MTENIKQLILGFFKRASVDFALMIEGPWGVGKTYFVKNSLTGIFKQAKLSPVYVSLNGVSSFEEVAAQIVFGTGWGISKPTAKSFLLPFALKYLPGKSVSAVISLLQQMEEKKAKGWLSWLKTKNDLSPRTHVIILDDLERVANKDRDNSEAVLMDILGRIFEEFISKGYYVVFIGAESEMGDKPRYFKEKEKYIRRTVDFKLNIDEIVDSIAASYTGLDLRHAKLCVEELKKFAKLFGVKNIRTIKRLMDDFLLLAGTIKDESLVSKIAFVLFYRLAPIANELALGRLNPSDEKIVSAIININVYRIAKYQKRLFGETASSTTEQEGGGNESGSFAEYFVAKYDAKLPLQWDYDQPIGEFELYGIVSPVELKACLSKWVPQSPEKYLKALSVIRSHEEIEDAELVANFPIVVEGLKSGKYSAEYTMLACAILCHLSENKWINVDCNEIITGAAQGLKERWLNQPNDRINPMILHNRQEDSLQPIVEAIQAEAHRREKKLANDEAQKFLDALENKDKDAVWSICPECQTCLIFDKIVESNKCSELCSVSNWALHLVWYVLKEREPFILPSSRNSIERLVKEFDKTIQACDMNKPLRKTRLNEVREKLVDILNKPEFKRSSIDDGCVQKH